MMGIDKTGAESRPRNDQINLTFLQPCPSHIDLYIYHSLPNLGSVTSHSDLSVCLQKLYVQRQPPQEISHCMHACSLAANQTRTRTTNKNHHHKHYAHPTPLPLPLRARLPNLNFISSLSSSSLSLAWITVTGRVFCRFGAVAVEAADEAGRLPFAFAEIGAGLACCV